MTNPNSLTLIIPAKYESESLPIFLEELKNVDYRILIVLQKDDYKTMNTDDIRFDIKLKNGETEQNVKLEPNIEN